jgi:hypothetical protein
MRTIAFRRHHRQRIINKRVNIIKNGGYADIDNSKSQMLPSWLVVGRLSKWNLTCGCCMCQAGKRTGRSE